MELGAELPDGDDKRLWHIICAHHEALAGELSIKVMDGEEGTWKGRVEKDWYHDGFCFLFSSSLFSPDLILPL